MSSEMNDQNKAIGLRLKSLRKKLRMNQAEYLHEMGIDVTGSALSNWESGNKSPSIENLIKIAAYNKVSLDWLLLGDSPIVVASSIPVEETEHRCEVNKDDWMAFKRVIKILEKLG